MPVTERVGGVEPDGRRLVVDRAETRVYGVPAGTFCSAGESARHSPIRSPPWTGVRGAGTAEQVRLMRGCTVMGEPEVIK